jgi:hypothetical protein
VHKNFDGCDEPTRALDPWRERLGAANRLRDLARPGAIGTSVALHHAAALAFRRCVVDPNRALVVVARRHHGVRASEVAWFA